MKFHPVGWSNSKLPWLLNPGHLLQKNISKTFSYIYQSVPVTFLDLGGKGYVSFDCAISNNGVAVLDKTLT